VLVGGECRWWQYHSLRPATRERLSAREAQRRGGETESRLDTQQSNGQQSDTESQVLVQFRPHIARCLATHSEERVLTIVHCTAPLLSHCCSQRRGTIDL